MKIGWPHFIKDPQEGLTKKFENLCLDYFLISNGLKHPEVHRFSNQAGVEIKPVQNAEGKYISFQSKYTDAPAWTQFDKSLKKTITYKKAKKSNYDLLSEITYYTNREIGDETAKQEKLDKLAKESGIELIWIYGDYLLRTIGNDLAYKQLIIDYFLNEQQPILHINEQAPGEGLYRYVYTVKGLPFVNFESQFQSLDKFCNNSEDLLWWSITGNAGSGKSRLAFEYSKKLLDDKWNAGFLGDKENLKCLVDSQPNKSTFIIVDYVVGQESELSSILVSLSNKYKGQGAKYKIRILFLERNLDSWLSKFMREGTSSHSVLSSSRYKDLKFLSLKTLDMSSEQEQLEFVKVVMNHFEIEKKPKKFLKTGFDIFPKATYLFFYILADFLPEWKPSMSREEVFRILLKRDEEQRWKPNNIRPKNVRNLVLSTISGGLEIEELGQIAISSKKAITQHQLMVGNFQSSILEPLIPDLVGELFVLDHFKNNGSILQDEFDKLIQKLLKLGKNTQMVSFFTKCSNDYPNHTTLKCLTKPFKGNDKNILTWAHIIVNVLYNIQNFEIAQKLYLVLLEVCEKRERKDHNFSLFRDLGLNSLLKLKAIVDYSKSDLESAEQTTPKSFNNPEITPYNKVGISGLNPTLDIILLKPKKLSRLKISLPDRSFYITREHSMEDIFQKHQNVDPIFANILANSYSQHEFHYLNDLDVDSTFKIHSKFHELVLGNKTNKKLAILYIRASKNIVGVLHNYNQLKEDLTERVLLIEKFFDQFNDLYNLVEKEDSYCFEISEFMSAAVMFVKHDKDLAWNYFERLESLAEKKPEYHRKIYYEISRSAVNLSSGFKSKKEWDAFSNKLIKIESFSEANNFPEIREMLGMIYGNIVNHSNNEIVLPKVKKVFFEKHKSLCFDNPKEIALGKGLLRGVTTKASNLLHKEDFEKGRELFCLVEEIYKLHNEEHKNDLLYVINESFKRCAKHNNYFEQKRYFKSYLQYFPKLLENHLILEIPNNLLAKVQGLRHKEESQEELIHSREMITELCKEHGQNEKLKSFCEMYSQYFC